MGSVQAGRGSWASSEAVRNVMLGNRSRDTRPEVAVRRELHRLGHRYRVALRPIPGLARSADIAFTKARVAVFIDGCFWHGCPAHGTTPRTHEDYWVPKLEATSRRDTDTARRLEAAGWTVVRAWEHEGVAATVERVEAALRASAPYLPTAVTPETTTRRRGGT